MPFDPAAGHFVKINTAGQVDEGKTSYDVIDVESNTKLAFIYEYSESDGILEIVPVNDSDAGDFIADETGENFLYQVTDDTVVTMLTFDSKSTTNFDKATISLLEKDVLGSSKNDYKCYNDKMLKEGSDKYYTAYGEYIKCYISYTEQKDDLPKVDYIVIVVHNGEAEEYLDIK